MDWEAFFCLHRGLDREGPGLPEEAAEALRGAGVPRDGVIAELGCGPGADLDALAALVPDGRVVGIEAHPGFVAEAQARITMPNATVETGDMAEIAAHADAPFDAVWSAGALYFMGLETGPSTVAGALKPGGVLAFSEPCFFTETPSQAARDFWDGYETRTAEAIAKALKVAGFDVLRQTPVSEAAWEAYFQPLDARIAALRPDADPALTAVLDAAEAEARAWRALRRETGYLISVARTPA
ncbi:trans-aconitate 2-methyltransferase [Cognatishimia sp. F0-27]|uniref:class I SAM-dependent methyltransferase n=1 Tax=Cognatishimia sp. F0-27 TaxID=2816855 RepID=UPI001D0C2A0F|nr:class I SAM-dependent methyltransferase [Cognatishimia sp. F0-27]MCC1491622.1 methyltransferase domain-containing protein [Cognatishimia sp. F0-27]